MTAGTGRRPAWNAEELRRAALEALGTAADERAVDALRGCAIAITPAVTRWHASEGPVEAHRVTFVVDARTLGMLRSAPALVDALSAAVAVAIASRAGESLLDLSIRWAPAVRAARAGYRDAAPAPTSLTDALAQYLEASGEGQIARALAGVRVEAADGPALLLGVDRETWESLHADSHVCGVLTRAAQDLLGSPRARVRKK